MDSLRNLPGRHRLGIADGVHCILIPEVADALAAHRRHWFTSMFNLNPARHSFASMRRRGEAIGAQWGTATAS